MTNFFRSRNSSENEIRDQRQGRGVHLLFSGLFLGICGVLIAYLVIFVYIPTKQFVSFTHSPTFNDKNFTVNPSSLY